jgi:hypothetical protein
MNPKQFLLLSGIIFVALALLGVYGLGPSVDKSTLGSFFWLDNRENSAHLVLGIIALLAFFFLKDTRLMRWLVIIVGVVALLATIIGFMSASDMSGSNFYSLANLENPAENILNLAIAVWAFYAAFMGKGKQAAV